MTIANPPRLTVEGAGPLDYALLFGLATIWGSSFMFQELVLPELSPASISAIRLVSATAVLAPVALLAGERLPSSPRLWALIVGWSLFGNGLPFLLIAWGQDGIDAGLAAILMGLMPIVTLVLAHFFTNDERITPRRFLGVATGFAGLLVLVGPTALAGLGNELARQLACLAAGVCYAINVLITRYLTAVPRTPLLAVAFAISAATIGAVALAGETRGVPSISSVAICVMLGVVHTAMTAFMVLKLVQRQGSVFFAQVNLLVPITGVLIAFVVLGERPGLNAWAALLLIVAGVAIARRRPQPATEKSQEPERAPA